MTLLIRYLTNLITDFITFKEIQPTLDELGIASLEEMGYDKPDLALPNPYEVHGWNATISLDHQNKRKNNKYCSAFLVLCDLEEDFK